MREEEEEEEVVCGGRGGKGRKMEIKSRKGIINHKKWGKKETREGGKQRERR